MRTDLDQSDPLSCSVHLSALFTLVNQGRLHFFFTALNRTLPIHSNLGALAPAAGGWNSKTPSNNFNNGALS